MKVLINIITPDQVAKIQETYPNFGGIFTISGQSFIPGEWVHVADSFVIPDNRKPFIKNVRWVLAALTRRHLGDYMMHQFAQGVKDAAEMYGDAVPAIATTVLAIAPEDEIEE